MRSLKVIGLGFLFFLLFAAAATTGALADRLFVIKPLDLITKRTGSTLQTDANGSVHIVNEQSSVIDSSERVSPSVVTVAITKQQRILRQSPFMGFDPFGVFGGQSFSQDTGKTQEIKQDIGSGFVVDKEGLIVTNKHVVSDTQATYRIITKDDKEYEVKKIYRDPINDLAILKVEATLPPIELGDSEKLKVGQSVIAIGTALGEFRHTVTTGVISGLGRGITAGENGGAVAEKLDNVIQTDAAINPGNSGGPLLNWDGQVIGVNVAVAEGANGIGFALPINVIKESLKNFEATGKFSRPFLGVQYRIIPKQTALLNDVAAGALVIDVVKDSPAEKAGLKAGDVLTKFDGTDLTTLSDQTTLSALISKKKVGDKVSVDYMRDSNKASVTVTLEEAGEQ